MGRARVILADDHADFLAAAAEHLEPEFEVIKTVSDGQSAVEAATRLQPDLLVLDIGLPALNGIEAARQLRADGSHAKIVFLTVHDDGDYVRAAQAASGLGYVTKPRLASDLKCALRDALAGRSFVSPGISDW
jgi:DNA-binding NarL/FixJ family response regulator